MSGTFVSALGRLPATPNSFSYNSYHQIALNSSPQTSSEFSEKLRKNSTILKQPLPTHLSKQKSLDDDSASVHNKRSQMPVQVQQGVFGLPLSKRHASIVSTQPISYMLTNVPRGLEYLAGLDRLFVRQKVNLVEVFFGCEKKNEYEILDGYGHQVFYASEELSSCMERQCLGAVRPFEMTIRDGHQDEVIHLIRPLACFPFKLQCINVFATSPNNFVGSVQQVNYCWPYYEVKNASGEVVLLIEVPICAVSCVCGDVDFKIFSKDRTVEVGRISKKWSGVSREFFTDADNFGLNFPVDLDVRVKAVLLGATMLIDYMFFERSSN